MQLKEVSGHCKRILRIFLLWFFLFAPALLHFSEVSAQELMPARDLPPKYIPDTRIDNMSYWRRLAELGLVPVQPPVPVPAAVRKNTKLSAPGIATYDSPDIPVTETNSLQSENSIFVDPLNGLNLLNSNNSHPAPYSGTQFGADALQSSDGGLTWEGTIQGAGGYNFGDPATAINTDGRLYVGFIFSGGGQGISYSDDNGQTWKKRGIAPAPGGFGSLLDKNHLWIDNSLDSPYTGFLYAGWTVIGGGSAGSGHLQVSRSMDGGLAWQNPVTISNGVSAGSHNQGINLNTGPLGELYATWAIYDSWPSDETALGFASSIDGGHTWQPAKRIITNIKGIRTQGVNKLMRVNSFPSMAVDNSNGPDRGSIYVVWANRGVPGVNKGSDVDIYLIKSSDSGDTWSEPIRVNQDAPDKGKEHYFPWVSCDPENGYLSVVFYDDRNVSDEMCETWVAVSKNGALTWQDFRISDVSFTPLPLTGMSDNYFGDYLGISSKGGMVFPCWTDNRTGEAMGYVSPFRVGPPPGQPYIDYYSHIVNDTLTGNGNSIAEAGETFALSLTMRNIGDQPDSSVNVTISCESSYVQIMSDNQYYGNFGIGELKSIQQVFLIKLSDSIPDNQSLLFTLSAKNNTDSLYFSSLLINSQAPNLSIGPLFIIDSDGNDNNQLDPGETVLMGSVLSNTSAYEVASASSKLSTSQEFCHISDPVVLTGPLAPGESDTVFWQVSVDPSVVAGTLVGFTDSLSYVGQQVQKLFLKKIGVLTEDWESGDISKMAWQSGGSKPWNVTTIEAYEGLYSLRSGNIKSLDTTTIYIVLNLAADDSISFYRKISSELSYDFLSFYIDNTRVAQWSGEKDWARVSFPVQAGLHTLKWEYTKDLGLSVGYDAAWIDFIQFPVQQRTTAYAGPDARVCEGNTFQPEAIATNYISLKWSTTGSGFFNDPGIINPVYFPSPADIAAGSVQLIITLTGFSYGETEKDTLVLTFVPKPSINAGPDDFTCTGEPFITDASATNYVSVHWITAGDGIFSNSDSLITHYSAGPDEIHNKQAMLILQVVPDASCSQLYDTLLLEVYPGFTATFAGDTSICLGDTANLRLNLSGQGPWRVYISDGSTINLVKPVIIIPVSPLQTTVYSIDSIVNFTGCTFRSVLSAKVNVLMLPVLDILGPAETCPNNRVVIQAIADSAVSYTWDPGTADTPFIQTIVSGNTGETEKFRVKVSGSNGCTASDSILIKIVADCSEKKAGVMDVRYYPNPSNGEFNLELSSAVSETAEIRISSADNKLVYYLEKIPVLGVVSLKPDLTSFAQGTYVLFVKCSSGEIKDKLVIKK